MAKENETNTVIVSGPRKAAKTSGHPPMCPRTGHPLIMH